MEELLEHNHLNDAVSGNFAARHHFESYLCRYRSCPRAIQGFSSLDLRQEHENSHAPIFRCINAACAFFGKSLKNRAALNKHNNKYHGDDGLTAIPTSLRKTPAHLQQDRPRFLLKETSSDSRKRSYLAAEEDTVISEVSMAINPAPDSHNARPLINKHQGGYILKCICGLEGDVANTIFCDTCETWQHSGCYYVDEYGEEALEMAFHEGSLHFCVDCKPRPLDMKGAADRQMKRAREKPRVEEHALMDYVMQLMLLKKDDKKKRLRQQDLLRQKASNPVRRANSGK